MEKSSKILAGNLNQSLSFQRMDEFHEQIWTEDLDKTGQNKMVIRIRVNHSYTFVQSFAVILIRISEKETIELFKADGNLKEQVHTHYYFKRPPEKRYRDQPISIETVEYYIDLVRSNWRKNLSQYSENYI